MELDSRDMLLAFETRELRSFCEEPQIATTLLGAESVRQVFARLADLRAASNLAEVPFLVTSPVDSCIDGFVIDAGACQLRVVQNHISRPMTPDGELALDRVTRVRIIEVIKK